MNLKIQGNRVKIAAVFNNNVVLALDELGREVVLTGRGVGFQGRPGGEVDLSKVTRRFVPVANASTVAQLLADIEPEELALVAQLFGEAVRELGSALPSLSVVAVADHIHQAIERVRRGEVMPYPLRAEVAYLHPQELALAEKLLERLNSRLDVRLPQGEAYALAMHLFHACSGANSMEATFTHSALIRQVFDLLASALGKNFQPDSIAAARFAAHLRYFFVRDAEGRQYRQPSGLTQLIVAEDPEAFRLAQRIRSLLELRLAHPLSDDELAYLGIHVARLRAAVEDPDRPDDPGCLDGPARTHH